MTERFMKGLRKIVAYTLLVISTIAFVAFPFIPFLDYEAEKLAVWTAGVFIFAEVTWWIAIPMLGPEIITLGKELLKRIKACLNQA